MKLSFLTNENELLQQKMRYFADYYQFVNKYLGKLPPLPFETPVSLLDKIYDQIQYKDIHTVMQSQTALVDVVGSFTPKIVKMDGAGHRSWKKKKEDISRE